VVYHSSSPQGWSLDTLQKYIFWVRSSFAPTLEPAAEQLLVRYYQLQRRVADRHRARTTIRMLESLVRLSQVPI
jgi:DNA helicase MCM9